MSLPILSSVSATRTFPSQLDGASDPSAMRNSAPGRKPEALDVLFITSTEQFLKKTANELAEQAVASGVPLETIHLEELKGTFSEEKTEALREKLRELRECGKIDRHTQVMISLHGSVINDSHILSNKERNFSAETAKLVSLISQVLADQDLDAGGGQWEGAIHIDACHAASAVKGLRDKAYFSLLYGGSKPKFEPDSKAIFSELIRKIGEYRKNPQAIPFPSVQDLYEAAGSISGEKVSMIGKGKIFQIRSGFLPAPEDLVKQGVMDKLERSLLAKLAHGKTGNVEKIVQLLGPAIRNIKSFSPLHFLARQPGSDVEAKIKLLQQAGLDINDVASLGGTPLHEAVAAADKPMVRLLVKLGADLKIKNASGQSVMATALKAGDMEVIDLLVEAGADPLETDKANNSALRLAWDKNQMRTVEKCFDSLLSRLPKEADFFTFFEPEFLVALLEKNEAGIFFKIVRSLPDKGSGLRAVFRELEKKVRADLRYRQNHQSNKYILRNFVEEMIRYGDGMSDDFKSFLKFLAKNGGEQYLTSILAVARFSEKWADELRELSAYARDRNLIEAALLFDAAVALKEDLSDRQDPDRFQLYMPDESGYTPFGRACRDNKLAECMLLHEANDSAIASLMDGGKSMLMVACEADSTAVIRWLLEQGADARARDQNGKSALDYAIAGGHTDAARMLRDQLGDETPEGGAPALQ